MTTRKFFALILIVLALAVPMFAVHAAPAGLPTCDAHDGFFPPNCVPQPWAERIFGCDVPWPYADGPAPWVADESGRLIDGSWAIPNDDGQTYRIGAFIIVNPDTPVYSQLTNGVHTVLFAADKPPATCTPR